MHITQIAHHPYVLMFDKLQQRQDKPLVTAAAADSTPSLGPGV
jgi:hypothetical protein